MKKVDKEDMWILLCSTVRYSMGRRTYMSSLAGELVQMYHTYLTLQQLEQIVEEIDKELLLSEMAGTFLGSEIDHNAWKRTLVLLKKLIGKRKK